jgi:hypothetical protein
VHEKPNGIQLQCSPLNFYVDSSDQLDNCNHVTQPMTMRRGSTTDKKMLRENKRRDKQQARLREAKERTQARKETHDKRGTVPIL